MAYIPSTKSRSAKTLLLWAVSLLVLLISHVDVSSGAKFLITATSLFSMTSHYMGLTTITQALVDRGHEVTLLQTERRHVGGFLPRSYTANITYPTSMTDEEIAAIVSAKEYIMANALNMTILEFFRSEQFHLLWNLEGQAYAGCFELFRNENTLARLKRGNFDMIITFPVSDFCDALIAAYLDTRYIVFSGTRRTPQWHEGNHGMPMPISYIPFSFLTPTLTDQMNFLERVQNAIMRYAVHPLLDYVTCQRPIGQLQAIHDIRTDLSPWQVTSRADLWLCHHTLALEYAKPTVPNWIPIGGFTIKDPSPLPDHLETFIQGSGEHGFIVFTLGSGAILTSEQLINMFSNVFSKLPQRIIWRHRGTLPHNLGNNTLISDWLPQSDLIAHPKMRMLIYHAGSAGLHEAIHYGIPMLLIPLMGDQPTNAMLAAAKGMALVLDLNDLDEGRFMESIQTILHDSRYKSAAQKASAILRDRIASPLDTAVFWIEHVIKFGGDHLQTRAKEMGFIQLHSLDVASFLATAFFLWAYLTYIAIAKCCACLCGRKNRKEKKD